MQPGLYATSLTAGLKSLLWLCDHEGLLLMYDVNDVNVSALRCLSSQPLVCLYCSFSSAVFGNAILGALTVHRPNQTVESTKTWKALTVSQYSTYTALLTDRPSANASQQEHQDIPVKAFRLSMNRHWPRSHVTPLRVISWISSFN